MRVPLVSAADAPVVLRLSGELDIAKRLDLEQTLGEIGAGRTVIVSLIDVTHADSTALTTLLKFHRAFLHRGGKLALVVRPSSQPARIMHISGLHKIFTTATSEQEAERSLFH